jgi:hypothetical protein
MTLRHSLFQSKNEPEGTFVAGSFRRLLFGIFS